MSIVQAARVRLKRAGRHVPAPMRALLRPTARRLKLAAAPDQWWQASQSPWDKARLDPGSHAACNVCGWAGERFLGPAHCESATCPRCGSVARDRFLMWCLTKRTSDTDAHRRRVLETSPRLGAEYRCYMRTWFDYRASDFDLSAHVGDVQLDLQSIALLDASVDLLVTPHVLEHVPNTERALGEIYRVLSPGGRMLLQVPLQSGRTHVPEVPEVHADNTPVYFRFGWDLTDMVRAAGFVVTVLVPAPFARQLEGQAPPPVAGADDFDVRSMFERPVSGCVPIATDAESRQLGFVPPHQFVTWDCQKPSDTH